MKKIFIIILIIYWLFYLLSFTSSSDIITYRTINIENNTGTWLSVNVTYLDNIEQINIKNHENRVIDIWYLHESNIKNLIILDKDYTFIDKHINTIWFDYFKTVDNFDFKIIKKNLEIEKIYFPIYYKTMINNQDVVITVK